MTFLGNLLGGKPNAFWRESRLDSSASLCGP